MSEIIALENIGVKQHAASWMEAIKAAGNLLVNTGSITEKYIDDMIESINTLGPYIVIMPGFALGHAKPCEAVIKSDMSIVTFDNDIIFNTNNDPVRVVMCLACTDATSHIERLQVVASKLMEDNIIEKMCQCQTNEELYNLINS